MNPQFAILSKLIGIMLPAVVLGLLYAPMTASAAPRAQPTLLPFVTSPEYVRGIQGTPGETYSWIPWRRIGYPTCGWGTLKGDALHDAIENYHRHGIRVLLTICQPANDAPNRFDTAPLYDAAQGFADAVQCGNEEMKVDDPSVKFLYWTPVDFARFYSACERAVHAARPGTPVLFGSLDPHVGGIDYPQLGQQIMYLNDVQTAMNKIVQPGSHWSWHRQTLGLINTWHDGYPTASTNSLYYLLIYWAQQFHVDPYNGDLGKHIWVVEGTACFTGCGFDQSNKRVVAIVHTIAMITDVDTADRFKVPFFYFSGKDFFSVGQFWPIGVLDLAGHPKPLRQDLRMGARSLTVYCWNGSIRVIDQERLLSLLYAGCQPQANFSQIISS